MNNILVIRISPNRFIVNERLASALAGNYEHNTLITPLNTGGIVSNLITERSFEEIIEIVTNADCGDDVKIIDANSPVLISVTVTKGPYDLSSEDKEKAIEQLLAKRANPLSETEAQLLTALLS